MLDPSQIPKDPASIPWITYLWVVGLSAWGGLVSFYSKTRRGVSRAWNITELVGELATSALSGVITFYLCEYSGTPPLLSAALIAISGHMGSRLIFMVESRLEDRAARIFDLPDLDEETRRHD